jgi:hypothetical protein
VDDPVHNSACPGDNWHQPVEDQNSLDQLAENPCQASEVGLEITYVTGNGDPHRTRQADGSETGATWLSDLKQSSKGNVRPAAEAELHEGRLSNSEDPGRQGREARGKHVPAAGERGNA